MKYTGARILVESLIEQGVDTIFGYPGGSVLNIYDELLCQRNRIRHILVSHEQHAAHAADGYARATGRTGICLASSGPGATNLITGIATAYMDSVPLIAITGNVPARLLGKDSFQEVDIAGISMPVVKHNWIVKDVNDLAEIVREAFIVARFERPGPVLIDIPKNITAEITEWTPADKIPTGKSLEKKSNNGVKLFTGDMTLRARRLTERSLRSGFNEDDIARAAAMLLEAERPLIYAGGGVIIANAAEELRALAERLDAPVALSLMGTGAIAHNHRLCTGLIGMHGTIASNRAAQKADLLVAVGARFSDRVTSRSDMFAKTARVLHFDIDPAEISKNIPAHTWVTGDLKETLALLLKRLPAAEHTGWIALTDKWKKSSAYARNACKNNTAKNSLRPRFVVEETAKKLGPDCVTVTDVGQHQIWAAQFFPAVKPRSFISPGGLGTMGFGLGAAIGASVSAASCHGTGKKSASASGPVVLFTGDGSFRMNSAELATLVQYKIPVLIIIFNNHSLGMVRQWQDLFYESRFFESDLPPCPDFVKLAASYGVNGVRAGNERSFLEALDSACAELSKKGSFLIEAVIDKDEKVLPMVPSGVPIDEQIL